MKEEFHLPMWINSIQMRGSPKESRCWEHPLPVLFTREKMMARIVDEQRLWDTIPRIPDLQCGWLLGPRANHIIRTLPLELSSETCQSMMRACGGRLCSPWAGAGDTRTNRESQGGCITSHAHGRVGIAVSRSICQAWTSLVCVSPNAFICVSPCVHLCVTKCVHMCVTKCVC